MLHRLRPRSGRFHLLISTAATLSLLLSGLAIPLLPHPVAAQGGLGISPSEFVIDDAMRGRDYATTITVLNELAQAQEIELRGNGVIASWLRFGNAGSEVYPGRIRVERGKALIRTVLRVPASQADGTYPGTISVIAIDSDKAAEGAAVGVSFEITVSVHVTGTQRLQAQLGDVVVRATEVGAPLLVNARVVNSGNVSVDAVQHVVIRRKGAKIDEFSNADAPLIVDPDTARDVVAVWDTKEALPGEYELNVEVSAAGLELGTRTVGVRLAQPGSLSRTGKLNSFGLVGTVAPGGAAQIGGSFMNTGEASTSAVLAVSLYRGKTLISQQKSETVYVVSGEALQLDTFFNDMPEGSYRATGVVSFDGRRTPESAISFRVGSPGQPVLPLVAAGGAAVLIAAIGTALLRRRRAMARGGSTPGGMAAT